MVENEAFYETVEDIEVKHRRKETEEEPNVAEEVDVKEVMETADNCTTQPQLNSSSS